MSKDKRLLKVTKELLKDPTLTTREVASKTGVSKSSVANYIKKDLDKLGHKDDRIKGLLDTDLDILTTIQKQKIERLNEKTVNDSDIDKWENTANKRRLMFGEKGEDDDKVTFILG